MRRTHTPLYLPLIRSDATQLKDIGAFDSRKYQSDECINNSAAGADHLRMGTSVWQKMISDHVILEWPERTRRLHDTLGIVFSAERSNLTKKGRHAP